jgi:hypothetical protein
MRLALTELQFEARVNVGILLFVSVFAENPFPRVGWLI